MWVAMRADMLDRVVLRCLIVDDSERFLVAARDLLEREGIDVVGIASTTEEAIEHAARLRPDVTLVDIDLGADSGFDTARRLAENACGPASSVILTSTYSERDFADLIEASPAIGFVSKSELSMQAILALLEREPGADANTPPGTR
jgi:two-component system, NarL family, nitrate/nitrite response regulator NarL